MNIIQITPKVPASKVNKDGTYTIRILISFKGGCQYISTKLRINNLGEWKNGQVVNRLDASVLNSKIRNILNEFQKKIDLLPAQPSNVTQVKEYLLEKKDQFTTFKQYAVQFLDMLNKYRSKSYHDNAKLTFDYFSEYAGDISFPFVCSRTIRGFDAFLRERGQSDTTINIRMSHLKALINSAIADGVVVYQSHPFLRYTMPPVAVRDLCLSKDEFIMLRDADLSFSKPMTIARDMFLLSFYCAGMNLIDLIECRYEGDVIEFHRSKVKARTNVATSFTIMQEAKEILARYIDKGKLKLPYHYSTYKDLRSYISYKLRSIGVMLHLEKPLMFYSARKTFAQFAFELGIPLYILEYAIGHTIKDASHRPVFNYIQIMRPQADSAIRKVLDFVKE